MAPKTDVIEQLRTRIAELEEENARLKAESRDACLELNDYYGRKLAAEQEEIEHLKQVQECHAIDLRERDASIKSHAEKNRELKAQLATAEQRVAEACALQVATETKFHWLDASRVAKEIRSGEYRKFMKEV